jgi:hypothetical protein
MVAFETKRWLAKMMSRLATRIGLVLGIVVGVGLAVGYKAHRTITRDPQFCVSCHSGTSKSWAAHAHKNRACQECHKSEFASGVKLWTFAQLGKTPPPRSHGVPDLQRCRTCHADSKSSKSIAKSSGHLTHVLGKLQLKCDQCHQLKGHSTKVGDGVCQQCHSTLSMHDRGMAKVTCLSCHDYNAPPTAKGSIPATGCPKCHSGKAAGVSIADPSLLSKLVINSDATHGNVNACRLCHDPHAADAGDRRRGMDCERCHKGVTAEHQQSAIAGHPNCSTCHQIHGTRPQTPALCAPCHQAKVPGEGSPVLAARHENCSSCHKPHAFKVNRAACASCHKPQVAALASWTDTRHTDCLTCHKGHAETKAASNCVTCHKAQQAHGHPDCIKCHEPHLGKAAVRACNGCHADQAATVVSLKPAQHRVCASCHDPHNAGATQGRCGSCHQRQRALAVTAPTDAHKRCSSCHQQHQFQKSATVCVNCHKTDQRGPHSGACLKCHQPHGPPVSPELDCRSCHQQIPEIHGKHAACTSCHAPHRSSKGGPACSACHTSELAGANHWVPVAHRGCQSCHDKHAPMPPKACAECHSPITSKPLFKGHGCLGCHDPHQPPAPWFGRCGQCHAAEFAATRSLTGTHSNCKGCHEPHTDKLPSCQSCHQSRAGSHATKGHGKCLTCHESHSVKVQGRDKCLSCHQDKKDHFPAAAQCAACHLFK